MEAFGRLLDIMDELRLKCPWDREQTNESLRANTIEETYELAEAIIKNDNEDIKKSLGMCYCTWFLFEDWRRKRSIRYSRRMQHVMRQADFRHPHVFGDAQADSAHSVEKSWEQIKLKEKGGNKTVLEGVPSSLPSLIKALRIQDKARNSGFDWNKRHDVWDKVKEEIGELEAEIEQLNPDEMEGEFGDVLFSIINAARLYGVNPDNALERTNQKFIYRFNYMEQKVREQGKSLKDMPLDQMEDLWQEAKQNGF